MRNSHLGSGGRGDGGPERAKITWQFQEQKGGLQNWCRMNEGQEMEMR